MKKLTKENDIVKAIQEGLETLSEQNSIYGDSDGSGNLYEFLYENNYLFDDLQIKRFSDLDINKDHDLREYYHGLAKEAESNL